ncbi:hypothetical protein ACHQM5_002539 [Ranunculus cassubicifolius]
MWTKAFSEGSPQNFGKYFATNLSKQCKSLQAPLLAGNINPSFSNFRLIAMAAPQNEDNIDVPKSVPVRVAHELLQAGHRYLDVRTPEEFSGGHAVGAVNVPYMFKAGNGMTKNPNFLEGVAKHFGKDAEINFDCCGWFLTTTLLTMLLQKTMLCCLTRI